MPTPGKHSGERALVLALECVEWDLARRLSPVITFAVEEGLNAHGVQTLLVPVFTQVPSNSPLSWTAYLPRWCKGQKFDQVWVWHAHSKFDASFWEWIAEVAPLRIGLLSESMHYSRAVAEQDEVLRNRAVLVEQELQYVTHCLAVDECDVEEIRRRALRKAMWWPSCIPERCIRGFNPSPANNMTAFHGTSYYDRVPWLTDESLKEYLVHPASPEERTPLAMQFNQLNANILTYLQHAIPRDMFVLNNHVKNLRSLRRQSFELWLDELSQWLANVNLPSLGGVYPSRVLEGLAAGRPVISSEVPNRPRNRALFEDGEDILLFGVTDRNTFIGQVERLRQEPGLAQRLVEGAQQKIRKYHTVEARIRQVFDFIDSDQEPTFY